MFLASMILVDRRLLQPRRPGERSTTQFPRSLAAGEPPVGHRAPAERTAARRSKGFGGLDGGARPDAVALNAVDPSPPPPPPAPEKAEAV